MSAAAARLRYSVGVISYAVRNARLKSAARGKPHVDDERPMDGVRASPEATP
ncbi:hypothetical protein [Streptomyces sp. NPDC055105]|uniref:hypothetical protein n=1 Tax=Streptomyces sp. NPDC055105 TaxID=3365719 RepID=UPI0037D27751